MEAQCEWVRADERDNEQSQKDRGKTKKFKNYPYFCQNTRFSRLKWVVTKSPIQPPKHSKTSLKKEISKCFSWLEGLPASESRAELRKSLSKPRDWTFHSRISRQKWPAKTRLRLATWLTCDWVAKTGQNWIFEIFRFFKQNTFQKHLKHSKIFLCLN